MISTLFGQVEEPEDTTPKERKLGVWDMINSISTNKNYMFDEHTAKEYTPWIVNKSLGSFPELLYHVDRMNTFHHLSPQMQYDYYFHVVPTSKRYKKWLKKDKNPDEKYILRVAELLKCSPRKATIAWNLLNKKQRKEVIDIDSPNIKTNK